ncbi:MAG TPA: BrnT family toxin [Dissulfurispiraceae bacterium]|nr:BrnT family toxin [Dissulfurispiraceae bacterium]
MWYEWDETKRQWTIQHRGIDFKGAASFNWETAWVMEDDRKEYGEGRFVAIGYIDKRLYVMAFTMRGETIRIISLRKANNREREAYERRLD